MLHIPIRGMRDGHHAVELECRAEDLQSSFEEFIGVVRVNGELRKAGRRLHLDATATCTARLVCDYTTKEYDEQIVAEFSCDFLLNTELFFAQRDNTDDKDDDTIAVHEEEKVIDITDVVQQELAVCLPLKRVAPDVRDKSLEELVDTRFLADSDEAQEDRAENDDRWSALKNLASGSREDEAT
jgi:uncharacterized metal-binding protein YceD (DUF177 family)